MMMGVSLTWKPTDPSTGESFSSGGRFHQALEKAFGPCPMTIGLRELGTLRGFVACGYEEADELIDAINANNSIDIEAYW